MMVHLIAFCFLFSIFGNLLAVTPGRGCKKSDTDYQECMKDRMSYLLPHSTYGIKNIDLPPSDPTDLGAYESEVKSDFLSANLSMPFTIISGMSSGDLDVRYEEDDKTFSAVVKIKMEHLYSNSNFTLKGFLMKNRFHGAGMVNCTFDNSVLSATVTGTKELKNGKTYLKLGKYETDLKTTRMNIWAEKLYVANQSNETILKILNLFHKALFQAVRGYIIQYIKSGYAPIANKIYSEIALEDTLEFSQ